MTAEEHCSHATNPHKASQTPVVRTKLQLNKFGFDKKNKLKKKSASCTYIFLVAGRQLCSNPDWKC